MTQLIKEPETAASSANRNRYHPELAGYSWKEADCDWSISLKVTMKDHQTGSSVSDTEGCGHHEEPWETWVADYTLTATNDSGDRIEQSGQFKQEFRPGDCVEYRPEF